MILYIHSCQCQTHNTRYVYYCVSRSEVSFVSVPTVSLDYQQSMDEALCAYSNDINTLVTVVPNMWAGSVNGSDYKQEIEKAKQRIRKKIPAVQNVVSFSGFSIFV